MSLLEIKNISYQVETEWILKDVSLNISKGDCISIVGPSGSGKSTLLKICADLLPLTQGSLTYQNKPYEAYEPTELRKAITYCIQMPHLFGETVYDNLAFPYQMRKKPVEMERMKNLLEQMDLSETILSQKVASLSGGERQRVALARSLMFTPEVLLLDEVTSALDEENTLRVEKIIQSLNKQGVTVVWVTHHEAQSTRLFKTRLTMEQGKITAREEL